MDTNNLIPDIWMAKLLFVITLVLIAVNAWLFFVTDRRVSVIIAILICAALNRIAWTKIRSPQRKF